MERNTFNMAFMWEMSSTSGGRYFKQFIDRHHTHSYQDTVKNKEHSELDAFYMSI